MAQLLPDLRTLKGKYGRDRFLTDARITREEGKLILRFSNAIANYGKGPLDVRGDLDNERVDSEGRRKVRAYQYILQTGGSRRRRKVGDFIFDPDPDHDHWHFSDFATYGLRRRKTLIESRKQAFCLVDIKHVRPSLSRSPSQRWFPPGGCEDLRMGISVGWADVYERDLHGQFIDLSEVESGTYWLESTVNVPGKLREIKKDNNRARIRIAIDKERRKVRLLKR